MLQCDTWLMASTQPHITMSKLIAVSLLIFVGVSCLDTNGPLDELLAVSNSWNIPARAYGSAGDCDTVLIRASYGACRLQSNASADLLVYLCPSSDSYSMGHIIVADAARNTTSNIMQSKNVYRARLVGPEVRTPPIHYCGTLAIVEYMVTIPGLYHVEILKLYSHYNFIQPPNILANPPVAFFTISALQDDRVPRGCSMDTCPACRVPNEQGRWVMNHDSMQHVLQKTCITPGPGGARRCSAEHGQAAIDVTRHRLAWMPYACIHGGHDDPDFAACKPRLSEKRVCLIGDSQLRHMHYNIIGVLYGNASAVASQASSGNNMFHWPEPGSPFVYILTTFGELVDIAQCSHVFYNFGQWPISYDAGSHPWTPQRYARQVRLVAEHLIRHGKALGKQVFWVTTNTHSIYAPNHQDPIRGRTDWRTDPMFLLINHIAAGVMKAYQIPVIDTYSIAAPLFDLAYDGSHYVGPVGLEQARAVLTAVCS